MAEEITLEQVQKYTGIEGKTIEEFTENFKAKYFTEDQVNEDKTIRAKFIGRTIGNIVENTMKVAKGFDVTVNPADIKDKPVEDIFNHILEVKEESHQALVEKMKGEISSGADEKYKSLQEDYDKAKGKIKDIESVNEGMIAKLEETEKGWAGKLKEFKRSYLEKDIYNSLDYAPDLDPYKKRGFESEARELYKLDFDENEKPFIADKDGKRIEDPNKHGTFKEPKDVLSEYGKKAGVISENPKAGRVVAPPTTPQPSQPNNMQPNNMQPNSSGMIPRPQTRRINDRAKV